MSDDPFRTDTKMTAQGAKRLSGEAAQRAARDLRERATGAYGRARDASGVAYARTSDAVQRGYGETVRYGSDHPMVMALAGLGVGFALGALLGASLLRRNSD
jgi:ElaB/YqjD/DUF883 family membrane-anchored ribosome-binding protein